jgi:sugar lactone lactonase YvrE
MLPRVEGPQALGDLVFLGDDILASDQLDGRLYRLDLESGYEVLLDRGRLKSPQGLVLDNAQRVLYVADYVGGLYRLDLESGDLRRFDDSPTASYYGIDGLYRHGDWLIAVQNGIRPNRVSAHRLSDDGERIVESRILLMNHPDFDEPTLGTIADGAFYLVANSHWNRFDRDNALPPDLAGPVILEVELPGD